VTGSHIGSLYILGSRHLDQGFNHVVEDTRAVLDGANHFPLFGCQVGFEAKLRHPHDGVHAGAKLVTEPRDEFLLWLTQHLNLVSSAGVEAREQAVNEALTVYYGLLIGNGDIRA
jgi:hypothetical protein